MLNISIPNFHFTVRFPISNIIWYQRTMWIFICTWTQCVCARMCVFIYIHIHSNMYVHACICGQTHRGRLGMLNLTHMGMGSGRNGWFVCVNEGNLHSHGMILQHGTIIPLWAYIISISLTWIQIRSSLTRHANKHVDKLLSPHKF